MAKLLSLKLSGLAVLAATTVWASVVPDNIIQNNTVDKLQAIGAHGRFMELSDEKPLNDRHAVVMVLGMNASKDTDGPSEAESKTMTALFLANCQALYREQTGRELYADTKWYGYWYNSGFADPEVAKWLDAKIENNSDLTQAGQKLSLVCHSKGGNVAFCYWVQTDGRKVDRVITLATPHIGSPLADKVKVKQVVWKVFPYLHDLWWKFLEPRLPSDTAGTEWLKPNSKLQTLHREHPLTRDWFLFGSTIQPLAKGLMSRNIGVALLGSSKLPFGANQDRPVYTLGARLIEECGCKRGSDGMVPLESAWCAGFAGDANTIMVENHDHSEMLQGNGGLDLHRKVLECLLPVILRHNDPKLKSFDWFLPEVPLIDIPKAQTDGLKQARLVWVDEDGNIWVADDQFANPRKLYLPEGRYSWPQWMGDGIIATWWHQGGNDIVFISTDGKVGQLTNGGISSLAAVGNGKIAFLSNGNLVLRTTGGLAKVLVKGPLLVEYPPVFMGNKLYFAVANSLGGADLRWVSTEASDYPLAKTKLVESQVNHPIKVADDVLLAFKISGNNSVITVITGKWGVLRATLTAGMKELNKALREGHIPLPTLVDMDSQEKWLYVVIGNDIRQLDLAAIAQTIASGEDSMTLDQIAVWRASGTEFDAK